MITEMKKKVKSSEWIHKGRTDSKNGDRSDHLLSSITHVEAILRKISH